MYGQRYFIQESRPVYSSWHCHRCAPQNAWDVTRNESKAKELIKQSGIDIASKEISLLVNKDNAFKYEAAALPEEIAIKPVLARLPPN